MPQENDLLFLANYPKEEAFESCLERKISFLIAIIESSFEKILRSCHSEGKTHLIFTTISVVV